MRILLTGVAGKIGRRIARELLDHGYSVRGIDNRMLPAELRGAVEMRYLDIADPLAMLSVAEGCDAIIHVAAVPTPFSHSSSDLLKINVVGTQNILDAAVANGIKRVILTSSLAALGYAFPTHPCPPDYLPVDVSHPRRPQDIYGVSKLMNEESALAMTRLHGLTTIVLRPPSVVDVKKAIGRHWFPADREHEKGGLGLLWAYIDYQDLARAYRLALEAPLEGHHVFHAIADDVSAVASPVELAERHLPNLVEMASKLPGNSFYDLTPNRELLGFEAQITWHKAQEESA